MQFRSIFKVLSFATLLSFSLAKRNDCSEFKKDDAVLYCENDKDGALYSLEINVSNSSKMNENINKVLSFPSIKQLKYEIVGNEKFPTEINKLSNLEELELVYTMFVDKKDDTCMERGDLNDDVLKNLTKLKTLRLEYINLSASNIKAIRGLPNLQTLAVSNCNHNELLTDINQISGLVISSFDYNYDECSTTKLPKNIISTYKNLKSLTIGGFGKEITDDILDEISSLTKLEHLTLGSNDLGKFPKQILKLENLKELSLESNEIDSIPKEIDKLTKLEKLNLSYNQISKIPKEFYNLTHLTELNLGINPIDAIGDEIGKLTNLVKLNLDNIEKISNQICNLTNLKRITLKSKENEIKECIKAIIPNIEEYDYNNMNVDDEKDKKDKEDEEDDEDDEDEEDEEDEE